MGMKITWVIRRVPWAAQTAALAQEKGNAENERPGGGVTLRCFADEHEVTRTAQTQGGCCDVCFEFPFGQQDGFW